MTNSWRSSALEGACAAVLVALAGCGGAPDDGSGRFAEGAAAYALRDLAKAERCFADALAVNPQNVDALVMLARTELDLGRIAEAEKALEAARQLAGGDSDVMLLSAQAAFHARDFARAKGIYAAVAAKPSFDASVRAAGWAGLGVVEMAEINVSQSTAVRDAARTDFLRAIRLDGRNAAARYHLGVLYKNAYGYNESALDQFGIFVRLEQLADKRVQTVQQKTIPALREAIDTAAAQRDGVAKRDSAASGVALAKAEEAWKKQTFKTAKLRYAEAYEADVLSFQAALGLARCWEKTDATKAGQQEAAKYYHIARSLKPSSKDTALKAGDLSYRLGSYAAAAAAYSQALAASPYDVTAIDGLIRALQKTGNRAAAQIYQRFRDDLPNLRK